MKNLNRFALSFFAMTAMVSFQAHADVKVHDAQAYETAAGMKVGAALMELRSDREDKLISATSPVTPRVEIHTMNEDNGIMKMRKVENIALPADKAVKLEPTGYHLMLMDLPQPLKAGEEFPLTLKFEHAAPVTVTVKILSRSELKKTLDADASSGHSHEHHH